MTLRLDLRETGDWVPLRASLAEADLLAASEVVDVRPTGRGNWEARAGTWVGAAILGDPRDVCVDLRITPKIPVGRLLFLLSYSSARAWTDDVIASSDAEDVPTAVAEALVRLIDRALLQGVLQGYQHVDEAGLTLRGRVRTTAQITRRFGAAIPVEVAYDDYTPDIAENQILRAAVRRMLSVPGVPDALRLRLLRQLHRFAEVTELPGGSVQPDWSPSRLNARYQPALHLAELILRSHSFELGRGRVPATGFMLNMARVFENFLTGVLGSALMESFGGRAIEHDPWMLDAGGLVSMYPDLVWYSGEGLPHIVVDAKYKADKIPNADVYQLLAYCTAIGLTDGHLVYARGVEQPRKYEITGAGVTVWAHAVDLALPPKALIRQVGELASDLNRVRTKARVSA